ncbi:unnamed protein product [Phyllotreta striolata]|uniref:Uncharacterized protein n=1 Tax=Phyllotreta striolata TaxID=444603 RepID=A0A9N9XTT6_PHYSR|nr:unnamed protein product [Phyllotreta striolata]
MKRPITIIIVVLISTTIDALSDQEQWLNYKKTYSKSYRNPTHEKYRFSAFQRNLRFIEEHNLKYDKGLVSFEMGMNQFGDISPSDFIEGIKTSKSGKPKNFQNANHGYNNLPDEVDWRKKGAVTEVKDQKNCGACWAFSTTGSVESAHTIKTGNMISLSEQNLVDCAKDHCSGCEGGWMDKAMEYIQLNGIMTEQQYPYQAIDSYCRFNSSDSSVKVQSHVYVKTGDENDLKAAVAAQPVSVAIHVTYMFQFYKQGILNDLTCQNDYNSLNHAVLVVGYGSSSGGDYWIVKNSWASTWGMNGYILMTRNEDNQCGIATSGVYPVV